MVSNLEILHLCRDVYFSHSDGESFAAVQVNVLVSLLTFKLKDTQYSSKLDWLTEVKYVFSVNLLDYYYCLS